MTKKLDAKACVAAMAAMPSFRPSLRGRFGRRAVAAAITVAMVTAGISQPAIAAGDAAVIMAAYKGDFKRVQALVASHADVNATDENGYTALHWAAYKGYAGMASYLVQHGAALDKPDGAGCTPLMLAANQKHSKVVAALLASGAAKDVRSNDGFTALDYAGNDPAIVAALTVSKDPARATAPTAPEAVPEERRRNDPTLTIEESALRGNLAGQLFELEKLPPVEKKNPWKAAALNALFPSIGSFAAGDIQGGGSAFQGTFFVDGLILGGIYLAQGLNEAKQAPTFGSMLMPGLLGVGINHVVLGSLFGVVSVNDVFAREVTRRGDQIRIATNELERLDRLGASRARIIDEARSQAASGSNAEGLTTLMRLDGGFRDQDSIQQLHREIEAQETAKRAEEEARTTADAKARAAKAAAEERASRETSAATIRQEAKAAAAARSVIASFIAAGNARGLQAMRDRLKQTGPRPTAVELYVESSEEKVSNGSPVMNALDAVLGKPVSAGTAAAALVTGTRLLVHCHVESSALGGYVIAAQPSSWNGMQGGNGSYLFLEGSGLRPGSNVLVGIVVTGNYRSAAVRGMDTQRIVGGYGGSLNQVTERARASTEELRVVKLRVALAP